MYKISIQELWEIINALRNSEEEDRLEEAKKIIDKYDLYE